MKPPPFEYHAPTTVAETVSLLSHYGEDAKVLAGGQSRMPLLNFRLARPAAIVDINGVEELDYLHQEDGWLVVGALVRQRAAELRIQSTRGTRTVPAERFFVSYLTTALAPDELLVEARFPAARPRTGYAFAEFARRHGDFALVGVAAIVEQDPAPRCAEARLAFTGVGPVPILCTDEQGVLRGGPLTPQAMNAFAERAAG